MHKIEKIIKKDNERITLTFEQSRKNTAKNYNGVMTWLDKPMIYFKFQ